MKYLKKFNESIDPNEYIDQIEDILKYRSHKYKFTDDSLVTKGDKLFLNDKEIKVDEYGNVKVIKGVVSTIIGRILVNDDFGQEYNNIYSDGTPIRIGDDVLVDDEFMATVDGFSSNEIMVINQEEFLLYVSPEQIEKS